MIIDDITRQSLLYDFYGALLTERQREVMELYHEENLSLAEIAEEFGISRQGVHDALHKGEKSLESYEEKLGLVKRFAITGDAISRIESRVDALIAKTENTELEASTDLAKDLKEIKVILDKLEE